MVLEVLGDELLQLLLLSLVEGDLFLAQLLLVVEQEDFFEEELLLLDALHLVVNGCLLL